MSKSKAQKEAAAAAKKLAAEQRAASTPTDGAVAPTDGEQLDLDTDEDDEDDEADDSLALVADVDAPIVGEINDDGELVSPVASTGEAASEGTFAQATEATEPPVTAKLGRPTAPDLSNANSNGARELPIPDMAPPGGSNEDQSPRFTGNELLDHVEPADAAPIYAPPALGKMLRCDGFCPQISADEPFAVTGKVVQVIDGERIVVILEIAALGIKWPVEARCIRGDHWEHDHSPSAYPPPGAAPKFDERFRTSTAKIALLATRPAVKAFKAPRKARPGHTWARCVGDSVGAAGFKADDADAKQRVWVKDEVGEIPLIAIGPEHFVKVG